MPTKLRIRPLAVIFLSGLLVTGCDQHTQLSRIQQQGVLLVATRNSPSTYYKGAKGYDGLEYQLVKRFAADIGVTPRFVTPQNLEGILRDLGTGKVNMAAAGLTVTPQRRQSFRFSIPYQTVSEVIVYRRRSPRPQDLNAIQPGELQVIAGSSYEETLERLRKQHPRLRWVSREDVTLQELLRELDQGQIRLTVADSNELALNRRIYRFLKPAFDIGQPMQIAWAFPSTGDGSLQHAADRFFERIKADGTLKRLLMRFYQHAGKLNFVDKRAFRRDIRNRLPALRKNFQDAAEKTDFDWRLLAAIGYQESHWQADARSPTGVRGIMMLTLAAADQVGVKNRLNARQSIIGGARYLKIVEAKIPKRIGFDRLWFTLAGYNVGFGHLEDARILTQRQGGNPDRWDEVKKRLPLLEQKKFYKTLKYGFARGSEPVEYVENIRNYYDLLVWYDNHPKLLLDK